MNQFRARFAGSLLALLLCIGLPPALVAAPAPPDGQPDPPPDTAAEENGEGEEAESVSYPSFFASTTVTATGSRADTFQIATPVSVISNREIEEKAPDNAADLLRELPGVDVNGVGPNQVRPIIRGQRGLRVLFLENGLRMNNARRQTDFGEIPALIDIDAVETVEVVRGPASVLYGSDAIGGVLNLITQAPARGPSGTAVSIALHHDTAADSERAQANVSGRGGRFAYNLGLSYRDAEDYEAAAGSFGDITFDDEVTVVDTGLRDDSLHGYLAFDLGGPHLVTLRYQRYRADETGFGFVEPELLGESDDFRIRILYPFQDLDRYSLGYLGTGIGSPIADNVEIQGYIQSNERQLANDIDVNIGPIAPGFPDSTVEADTLNFTDLDTFGIRAELTRIVGREHLLTYGGELFRDDSFNTDFSTTTTTLRFPFPPFEFVDVDTDDIPNAPNATNTSYGVFAQGEIAAAPRLRLVLGARYQNVETEADATPGFETVGLDFEDDSLVGAFNLVYRLTGYLNLVASYGSAFRVPNIIERLFNGPTPEGAGFQLLNPDLTSEDSETVDVGLKYRRRDALFELIYFNTDIDGGIIQYFLSPEEIAALPPQVREEIDRLGIETVVQQRNIDRLRYRGLEVGFGYRFAGSFTVGGNYTYLDSERVGQSALPVENLFSDKINLYLRHEPRDGRYWVEYRVRHNGEEQAALDVGEPVPPVGPWLPSFTVHTLSAGVVLIERDSQRHTLGLIVDNLGDELYAEFSNATFFRPEPKRRLVASYRIRF